jgi:hypothetical protein
MIKKAFKPSKLFGSWGGKKKEDKKEEVKERAKRDDDIHIEVCQLSDNEQKKKKEEKIVLASGSGSWLSHLILDGEVVWRIEEDVP